MRYKVKVERDPDDAVLGQEFTATLYEDPPNSRLRSVGVVFGASKEEALLKARRKRDAIEARSEPEWFSLEDVQESQSLKAV